MPITLTNSLIGILLIAVVISAGAAGYFHDQGVKDVYRSFEPEISDYQNEVSSRDSQITRLQGEVADLRTAQVDGWFVFSPDQCYYSCSVRGAYSNHGTNDARNIFLTFTWKNNGAFVQTNTLALGNLAGRTTAVYPVDSSQQYFSLDAPADQLLWSFTWS